MNRFVSRKSIFFVVFAWALTFTLFADGANLDDLCAGVLVLHDDDEVTAPATVDFSALAEQGPPVHHAALPASHGGKNDATQSQAPPVRVIVDQDSPSLEAEWHLGTIFEAVAAANCALVVHQTPPSRDALHLQFCTLLI